MKKLINYIVIICLLAGNLMLFNSPVKAATSYSIWTTKGDFENNLSTTATVTSRNNIRVSKVNSADDAEVTLGDTTNAQTLIADFDSKYPAIAYNNFSNQYMVAWQDKTVCDSICIDTGKNIYAQRINADGSKVGPMITVTSASGDQHPPVIAFNSFNYQYIVAWVNNNRNIHFRRFDISGNPLGGEVNTGQIVSDPNKIGIAYNSTNNEYLFSWNENIIGGYSWIAGYIYAQRRNWNGNAIGAPIILTNTIDPVKNLLYPPSIAFNSNANEYLITWGYFDTYAQRLSGNGSLLGSNVQIAPYCCDYNESPKAVFNPTSNQYLVAWQSTVAFSSTGILGRLVNSNGTISGPVFDISANGTEPDMIHSPSTNRFAAVWDQGNWTATQQINSSGSPLLSSDIVVSSTSDSQSPAVAYNSSANDSMVAWSTGRQVYARRASLSFPLSGTISNLKVSAPAGKAGKWESLTWLANIPANTTLKFRTRGAETEAGLASVAWSSYLTSSGSAVTTPPTRWLEIEAVLESVNGLSSAELRDLKVDYDVIDPPVPTTTPNPSVNVQNPNGGTSKQILNTLLSLSAKPKVIRSGKAVTLKGQLKDTSAKSVVGKKIILKEKVLKKIKKKAKKGKKIITKIIKKWIWKTIAIVRTDAKGNFAKKIKPKISTVYKAQFSGDSSYKAANSNATKVIVRKAKKK